MRCRTRLLSVLLMAALLLSIAQPAVAQDAGAEAPAGHGIRFDAPLYAIDGPYAVSVQYFTIPAEKETDRDLTVSVWYPAQQADGAATEMVYEQQFAPGEIPSFTVLGHAQLDAPPDPSGAPYPLVVYSHATWTFGQETPYLTEHLASRGFVVISADHEDNWSTAFDPPVWQARIHRPQEVTRQIDFAASLAAPDGDLPGMIDTTGVGVAGWSMGGETSLAVAGARWDLNGLSTWCAENPEGAALNESICVGMLEHEAELAVAAGLEETPQGLWPSRVDARVRAVIPLSGYMLTFGSDGTQSVDVPTLFMVGSGAAAADPVFDATAAYANVGADRKAKVIFDYGEALMFFISCADSPDIVALGFPMFCTDPVWDMDRAHDLINHFATAFLLAELKGDAEAAAALAPENVSFPGIQYEATGYGESADAPIQLEKGYADVNGTHLYFEMAGEGEPVVFIHGLGLDTRDWNYQFTELAKNHQVVRYDMRGFGKSDMPTDQPYAHADDLKALLEFLGIESAHVFGHSFGGEIAINFALAYPEMVRSLVLIEPDIQGAQGLPALTPEEEASFAAVFAALEKEDNAGAALAIVDMHPLVAVAKDVPDARELILSAFTDYQWFQFLNENPVVQPEIASAGRIEEITVPTLLVVGDSTTDYQKTEVDRLVEGLPDAEKVVFENSDHFPHVLYPDIFNTLVLDFMAGVGTEADSQSTQLDVDIVTQIDAMVEETMARIDLPGFALAVVKDGEVVYAKGFGVTSLDGGAPVTSQTVFQWAETSMALTAMAVMQLVEAGKIDLDAPITDYVPYFKLADERYTAITVGQLMSHRSGIPDSGDAMADWENFMPQYDGGALERWVRNDLAEQGLLFAPGEGWEYSDLAYALLGSVIEAASGQPYEAYMTEHFFAPLGMDKSTFLLEEVDKTLLASPHVPDATGATVVTKAQPYHRPFAAANNLFANVADMAKLAQFSLNRGELNGVRLLPESAFDTMWTATTPTPFADFPFGRIHPSMLMLEWGNGWFLGDIAGHQAPNAGGGEHGYLAQMFLVPDANLGVVAVGNRLATDEYYAADIAADVLGMLLEE